MKNIIIKTLGVTFLSLLTIAVSAQVTNVKEKKETVKSGVKEVKTETKDTKAGVKSDVKDANENLKSNTKSAKEEVNSDAKEIKNEVKEAPAEIKNEAAPAPPKKKGLNLDLGSPTQPAGLAPSGKGGTNQRVINEEGIKASPSPKVNPK